MIRMRVTEQSGWCDQKTKLSYVLTLITTYWQTEYKKKKYAHSHIRTHKRSKDEKNSFDFFWFDQMVFRARFHTSFYWIKLMQWHSRMDRKNHTGLGKSETNKTKKENELKMVESCDIFQCIVDILGHIFLSKVKKNITCENCIQDTYNRQKFKLIDTSIT